MIESEPKKIVTQNAGAYREGVVMDSFGRLQISRYLENPRSVAELAQLAKLNEVALGQVVSAWLEQGLIKQDEKGMLISGANSPRLVRKGANSLIRTGSAMMLFARLGVADYLSEESLEISDLERFTGQSADLLRIVGSVWEQENLVENLGGRFQLTILGAVLISDIPGSMAGRVRLWDFQARYWRELPEIIKTGKPGPILVDGQGFYSTTQQNPRLNDMFGKAMTEMSADRAQAILGAYNFGEVECLVDIGGGNGKLLAEFLKANPAIKRGILFDLPEVVQNSEPSRFESVGGSYFEQLPLGGDLYFLSKILHNNPDEDALKILKNVRSSMNPQGKVLIADWVRADYVQATVDGRLSGPESNNMHMLVMTGGKERTANEFEKLLTESGFRFTRIIPTTADVSLIEAITA